MDRLDFEIWARPWDMAGAAGYRKASRRIYDRARRAYSEACASLAAVSDPVSKRSSHEDSRGHREAFSLFLGLSFPTPMGTELRTLIRDRIRHPPKEKTLEAAFHNAVCRSLRSNAAVEGSRCQIKPMPKATDNKYVRKCNRPHNWRELSFSR
jgi:hypothetical protein